MSFNNSFKKKVFQNGAYSIFISLAVVLILIVLNLMLKALPSSITNIDLSEQQMFSISDQTKKLLKDLDDDVTVYFVAQSGAENSVIAELLTKYEDLSKHIKVVNIDTGVNPTFASNYTNEGIKDNSLVVESDMRFQVISYDSIYVTSTEYNSEGNEVSTQSFNGEAELTSAIDYVTSYELPKAYNLIGHSEKSFSDKLSSYIAKENIELVDLSIASMGEIPDDCACLIINAPAKDISDSEKEMIEKYLDAGGHLLYVKNYNTQAGTKIDELVAEYGISVENSYVFEGNSSYTYQNLPYMIIPNYREHTITEPLIENMMYCLMSNSLRLKVDSSANAKALLTTTSSGYAKERGKNHSTIEKTAQDEKGAMIMAAVSESETYNNGEKTQIVVIAAMEFLEESYSEIVSDGNYDFVINSIGWMCEHDNSIAVHSKSLGSDSIYVTSSQTNLLVIILVIVIPVLLIASGIVIWIVRRRR